MSNENRLRYLIYKDQEKIGWTSHVEVGSSGELYCKERPDSAWDSVYASGQWDIVLREDI